MVDAVKESYSAIEGMAELDRIIAMLPYYAWLKVIVATRTKFYGTGIQLVLNEAAELEDMNLFVDAINGLSRSYE